MLVKAYSDPDKPCCSEPDIRNAAIGWKPFKVRLCLNCGGARFKNRFMEWAFETVLSSFWGGRLFIEK